MPVDVVMPRLSDSMETGTIIRWLVQPGDVVRRGQPLVEIETDKATMEFESEVAGRVAELLAAEGDEIPLGQAILRLEAVTEMVPSSDAGGDRAASVVRDGGASPPAREAAGVPPARAPAMVAAGAAGNGATAVTARPGAAEPYARAKASPVARRMARRLGVDLDAVRGTGPRGRISMADVEAAAPPAPASDASASADPAPAPAPAEPAPARATAAATGEEPPSGKGQVTAVELTRLQQTVARRVAQAKATIPHFYLTRDVDMTKCVALREQLKELAGDEPAPSHNDLIVKACAQALREHPRANGSFRDGRFELYASVNVGFAAAGDGVLVVPTVTDADRRSLGEIARVTRRLIARARDGSITPPELANGTFTVSNLGMFGIKQVTPVINPPQAAILGVGLLEKRPVWDAAAAGFTPRDMLTVTLACDHRILYGADAAEFLASICRRLEEPLSLAL